tara:strand:- start:1907 stop:3868 length:1962 start_codon:yes stop_codon:yes gene_type:complete
MADQKKNPNNPQSELFRRLTRLFSGPIVNWRTQMNRKIRRTALDKYATQFKSASGQQFRKAEYSPFDVMHSKIMAQQNRAERYVDYEQMEYMPEIASALDIYADEMTTHSALSPMMHIDCPNEEIKAVLGSLYENVLNLDHNLFGWCRSMCKFGDFVLYLDIDDRIGIKNVVPVPLREVERLEGEDPTNPNYVQYQWNSAGMTFENWQIAHFRILGNDKYTPYGTSVLDPGRRIWRQLVLMEDAMMAYRIVRSSERRVFYIDVGNISPQDVESYVQKTITSMKRNQVVDANTGRVDLRYNPLSVEEDYFIPVRGGESSKIESLAGGQFTGDIDDVKYLRDKMFSALKIPAAYLSNGEEGGTEDKTTLAQKDVRFARTIQRLQRAVISELEKIGIVHLYTLGFRGDDLVSFRLKLNNPSKIAELQELEHWKQKFDIAGGATENFFSRRWIAQHIFSLSEEEFVRNQREMFHDRRYEAELNAAAEAAGEAAAGQFGGDADDGLDVDPPDDTGGIDLDAGDDAEEPADLDIDEPDDAPADDEPLLAAPSKRDDRGRKMTTTKKSKSHYTPKTQRGGDNRTGRQQSYLATALPKPKDVIPGSSDLKSLSRGIYENKQPTYLKEEKDIFDTSAKVKILISELERTEIQPNEDETQQEA